MSLAPVAASAIKCRWKCIGSLKVYVFHVHTSYHEVGSGKKGLNQRELHLCHISLTAVRSNSSGDHLYFGCHCNGLGKACPTASHGQDQDFTAEAPPWLMISSWKLFYVEVKTKAVPVLTALSFVTRFSLLFPCTNRQRT